MSESEAAVAPNQSTIGLPCPLPQPATEEPAELTAFRAGPIHDSTFVKLRRRFREQDDWRSLATLLLIYADHITNVGKIAELSHQAYELWLDRVKDKPEAAHALARAVEAAPEHERAVRLLYELYADLDWHHERVILLRWRIKAAERQSPAAVPGLLVELAGILEEHFMAIEEAIAIYERALKRAPKNRAASEALIRLYLHAGSWQRASELMEGELQRLDPGNERDRIAELHLRLARIEHEVHGDVARAAVHLQSALKAMPDNVHALRAFGVMYLGSGKASDEGMAKASDIFFRAAKLASAQNDDREALKLLRRTLSLRPDHYDAGMMLAELLSDHERWTDLDDLYAQWIGYVEPSDAYSLWMQRGELLEQHLARREDARLCYETASQFEAPGGPAWQNLERLYASLGDIEALAGLFEAYVDEQPNSMPTDKLLKAAETYREELHNDERASFFFYKVLEREPFNAEAFEGYKEHWRRKNKWAHLRDLIFYQLDQAASYSGPDNPLGNPAFAEEYVEVAEICEKRLADPDGALDAWQRLQGAYPNDWRPRDHIARLDKRIRMLDQVERTQGLELARLREPAKRLAVLRRLAKVYRERVTDPGRAIENVYEILEIQAKDGGESGPYEAMLADLYARVGDYQALIGVLRQQFDAARRPAQQMELLRRMAAIWHDDLQEHDDAIWACEQLLSYKNDDLDVLHRLENLFYETGRYDSLYSALERELAITTDPRARSRILWRMGNVGEVRLADNRKASRVYADLLAIDPHNLEVLDKMAAIYEADGRYDDLATLLGKAAASSKTAPIRQLDYLMRLGNVAEAALEDPDLACSAFERVLRINRDHRQAVEALTRLYRTISSWHGLAAMLGNLQELVDTDEEVLQLGLERAEVLADNLDNASAAARVLEQLDATIAPGHPEIRARLTAYYARAGDHRKAIRHAEILLLATEDAAERRRLHEAIASSWIALGDSKAGLQAFERYVKEVGHDLTALRIQADLQEQAGDFGGAISTLDRLLRESTDPRSQVATLERMAEIAEHKQGHHRRAIALLGKALGIAPSHDGVRDKLEGLAARHGMWKDLLHAYGERFNELAKRGDSHGQIALCMNAAKTAEEQIADYDLAFAWAKKAYLVAVEGGHDAREARAPRQRLQELATAHGLWRQQLEVIEQELRLQERRGDFGDFSSFELLLAASDLARERLGDPERAIGFLTQAYALRPEDTELGKQIEELAERHELWHALVAYHEGMLERTDSALSRFEAHVALARLLERKLDDPAAAAKRLRTAWEQIYADDRSLAEEALDLAISLCERHELWAELADIRQAAASRLFDRKAIAEGLRSLRRAAELLDERCDDSLAALRVLRGGLRYDLQGTTLVDPLRDLCAKIDERRPEGEPPLGALTMLGALQTLLGANEDPAEKITWLKERAELRERQLGDRKGAMAEWLRILGIDAGSKEARFELERLAEAGNLWDRMLLVPAWELAQLRAGLRPGTPPTPRQQSQEQALWDRIAELYADFLHRPEYALRANLCAWRLRPQLPATDGDIGPRHGSIWHFAAATGAYTSPPKPQDPLLWPKVTAPEIEDDALWRKLGLHPTTLRAREERRTRLRGPAPAPAPSTTTAVDISELEPLDDELPPVEITGIVEISEIEPLDDDELIPEITGVVDVSELEPLDEPPVEITGVVEISEVEPLDDEFLEANPITLDLSPDDPQLVELRAQAARQSAGKDADGDGPITLDLEPDDPKVIALRRGREPDAPMPRVSAKRPPPRPPSRPHAAPPRPPSRPHAAPPRPPSQGHRTPPRPPILGHKTPPPRPPSRPYAGAGVTPTPAPTLPALTQGLPEIPSLEQPILPDRPAVADAWEEVAAAYREVQASSKDDRVALAMALARLYDEGADRPEAAFAELEEALILLPEHADAHAALDSLAARRGATTRLIQAYEHLTDEVTLPEHVVAYNLRLAELHHDAGNLEAAEAAYRDVLGVLPQHLEALEALASIYDETGRNREYIEIRSRIVDLQLADAGPEQREAMIRGLARDLDTRLRRPAEAIRRLEPLARELPERVDIQEELADLLRRQGEHAAAATVLRGALEHAAGDDRLRVLAALGALEERLGADDAAIERWQGILAARDGDPDALAHLQALYLKGRRWDALLEVIERRLAAVGDDRDLRIAILVDKARALLEGFGDEAAATSTLEALAAEDPDNDAVILGLCDLYQRSGRTAEAQERLRARLAELPAAALGPRAKIALALAGLLERELGDLEEAMATIEAALGDDPDNRDLLAARAHLARRTDDAPVLVDTLERLGDTDGLLEAAELAREALRDPDWSARLYGAILRGADKSSDDPRTSALLATALAGLARLRLDAGDREGIDTLVGDWVTQIPTAGLQARVLTELGRALWRATADLELARPRFDAAKAADPDYALATHRLGEVLLLAGRYDEAEPLLEDAVESHVLSRDQGHLIDGLLLLAHLFEATDRSADAYRRLSSALRQDPSSLEIRAAIVRNRHQAGRWKEAIAAVEKVDEQLAAGKVLSQGDRRRLAEMLVLASAAAAEQGDPDQELELFERAVKADPDNLEILDRLIARCRERGLQDRQARHTAARAEHLSDPVERGKTLLEAGMLAAAAAAAIEETAEAEGRDPADDERLEIDDLRDRAFVALRKGIALVIHEPTPVVERRQLEVAFWVSASRDTETALGCLDRLLLRDDLRRESRLELLLEGVRLALERRQGGDLERARVYAKTACDGFPERASPITAMFDVLEATGGDDAQENVERLVLMFFNRQGLRSTQGEAEDARRSALLIRLADTQHEHPERAIRLLEKAATLDTRGLGVAERRHLSRLYLAAGADAKRIRRNYEAILELDPVDTANIRALFDLCVAAEDLDQAAALAALLRVLEPSDAAVEALAARFGVEVGERDGFDINGIIPTEPASGGMIPAMRQLWRGGAAILCAKLPRLDTEGATLPESDDPFFTTWRDTQARFGAPPYPLVDAAAVAADVEGGWLIPHCQYPPVMVVGPKAKYEEASAHLRFAIGRSLFFARPGNLLTAALEQEQLVTVLAATLLAFHPRHAHRRDYIRDDDEATHQLAQHLSRKLPLKVSRAIAGLFQEHASEAFDSRDWRAWVERGGNRLGLCAAGDLEIALEILGVPSEPEARAEALRERVADDVILHDLLGFAGSARFAKARRGLGYAATLDPSAGPLPVLAPTSTPAELADGDAPPIAAEATEEEAAAVEAIADLEEVSDAEELLDAEDFPDAEEFLDAEELAEPEDLAEPDAGADAGANEDVDTGVEADDGEDLDTSADAAPIDRSIDDDGEASSPDPRLEDAPADTNDADDADAQGG